MTNKGLSKPFFMSSFIAGGLINLMLAAMALGMRGENALVAILLLSFLLGIYLTAVGCIMWFKAWTAIQDGHARTTPGKAVGFIFIPFYNLYWIFQLIPGFAKDFNAYIKRHAVKTEKLSERLFLTAAILLLVGCIINYIPFLGIIYSMATLTVMLIMINSLINAVNSLAPESIDTEVPCGSDAKEGSSLETKAIGIIAVSFSGYAIFQRLLFLAHAYRTAWGSAFFGALSLVYWGMVIYLGWLCKNKVLRIVAMSLPVIPIILQLWSMFQRGL